jgi:hypothetical protein
MTLFTMNIFFWENLVLIAVLFTGLPEWVEGRVGERGGVRDWGDDTSRAGISADEAVLG